MADVLGHIRDVPIHYLALALALKTAESAFIALGWRNILRAAYPDAALSFRTPGARRRVGTAINAVVVLAFIAVLLARAASPAPRAETASRSSYRPFAVLPRC